MARAGLGKGWECKFANDFDPMKTDVYRANWGDGDLWEGDVNDVKLPQLPGTADLAWASFPCQDLSLAGRAVGIGTLADQTRSGAFWAFWRLMEGLIATRRAPSAIVLENVYGSLTANAGRDFAMICRCLSLGGYRFGALMLDAVHFLPQSRPRVFILAVRDELVVPGHLLADGPQQTWHPAAMSNAIDRLAEPDRARWMWFAPPSPQYSPVALSSLIEADPTDVSWHRPEQTARLISLMNDRHRLKLAAMGNGPGIRVATVYKRTRVEPDGVRRQRAELREDGIAGCLRTPGGGSSLQSIIVVDGTRVRSRILSGREAARLMGLPDSYVLPKRHNDAYHIAGDGVAVPAVRYLASTLLEPILEYNDASHLMIAAE